MYDCPRVVYTCDTGHEFYLGLDTFLSRKSPADGLCMIQRHSNIKIVSPLVGELQCKISWHAASTAW